MLSRRPRCRLFVVLLWSLAALHTPPAQAAPTITLTANVSRNSELLTPSAGVYSIVIGNQYELTVLASLADPNTTDLSHGIVAGQPLGIAAVFADLSFANQNVFVVDDGFGFWNSFVTAVSSFEQQTKGAINAGENSVTAVGGRKASTTYAAGVQ